MSGKFYSHWQPGTVIRVACGAALAGMVAILLARWTTEGISQVLVLWIAVIATLILLCLYAFHGLGVEVAAGRIKVWFGPGWIDKHIAISEIERVKAVTNSPLAGWGIRWLGGGTTLWNVSGLDAVELQLSSGKRFRIGTDDPERLAEAIRRAVDGDVPSVASPHM